MIFLRHLVSVHYVCCDESLTISLEDRGQPPQFDALYSQSLPRRIRKYTSALYSTNLSHPLNTVSRRFVKFSLVLSRLGFMIPADFVDITAVNLAGEFLKGCSEQVLRGFQNRIRFYE